MMSIFTWKLISNNNKLYGITAGEYFVKFFRLFRDFDYRTHAIDIKNATFIEKPKDQVALFLFPGFSAPENVCRHVTEQGADLIFRIIQFTDSHLSTFPIKHVNITFEEWLDKLFRDFVAVKNKKNQQKSQQNIIAIKKTPNIVFTSPSTTTTPYTPLNSTPYTTCTTGSTTAPLFPNPNVAGPHPGYQTSSTVPRASAYVANTNAQFTSGPGSQYSTGQYTTANTTPPKQNNQYNTGNATFTSGQRQLSKTTPGAGGAVQYTTTFTTTTYPIENRQ